MIIFSFMKYLQNRQRNNIFSIFLIVLLLKISAPKDNLKIFHLNSLQIKIGRLLY